METGFQVRSINVPEMFTEHSWDRMNIICADGRFVFHTIHRIYHELNVPADLDVAVGCSKTFVDGGLFYDAAKAKIEMLSGLHQLREIWLFDHEDCAAYGGSRVFNDPKVELEFHAEQLQKASYIIRSEFPDCAVRTAYCYKNGEIVELDIIQSLVR